MNKTIIVTGGSRGIGAAIVRDLAKEGHNVILNYNNSEEKSREIQKQLKKDGINIEIFKADVSDVEQVKQLVKFTLSKFDNIDVLINNAGISQIKTFTDVTDQDWNNIINTNLASVFYCSREVLPNMIYNKKGCIINISSIWGLVGSSCEVPYSASKAGIDGITKALAKELAPSSIRVNSIAPGAISTDMNKIMTDDEIKELNKQIPLGKMGEPEDIVKCIKWLIEDNYTTGQVISINGGWVI